MCKDEGLPTPMHVPLADIQKAAPQLAMCKKAAQIMDLKPVRRARSRPRMPMIVLCLHDWHTAQAWMLLKSLRRDPVQDIGAVTVGGNRVGLEYSLDSKTNVHAVVKASYVANVCFVGSCTGIKCQDTVLLPHCAATIKDLKRSFYERHKSSVIEAAIKASGLKVGSEEEALAFIVCRGVDGCFLADQEKLPKAVSNACSDVGYHAQFFLDITPASMREIHIKSRINASPRVIADFVQTTRVLGASQDQPQEYPGSYGEMQQEMQDRLQTVTRHVPAALSPDDLEDACAEFQAIIRVEEEENGGECGSNLPLAFKRYATELAEQIRTKEVDSLSVAFPCDAASGLMAMHPYVKELARVQRSSEWTNYATETDHEDGLALCDIVSELKDREESLKQHVSMPQCILDLTLMRHLAATILAAGVDT